MNYFLPTYDEAKEMVNSRGELIFYENVSYIDGYKVSMFNYRLAQYSDFLEPVIGKNYKAHELRGLTFVFNLDGSLFKRYLLFNKFFNLNQVTESMYDVVKDKKIMSVYNKDDGSLISFIKLPNGRILSKTKMSIDNEQVGYVNSLLTREITEFVSECFEKDLVTMWEYVSFKNKIVLSYDDSNLILLKVRNNKTGEYLDVEEFKGRGFDIVEKVNFTDLNSISTWSNTAKDVEGVVVTFEDEFMVKIKTQWYLDRHHLLTEETNREDYIIKMILEETIDDVKGQLDSKIDKERLLWIENIENVVINFIKEKKKELELLLTNFDGNIKDFAIKYKKDKNFSMAMNVIRAKSDTYAVVKKLILKSTNRLLEAKTFIKTKTL